MKYQYVKVILPFAVEGAFTYNIPVDLQGILQLGHRVLVQFGKKRIYSGIVIALRENKEGDFRTKPVLGLLDEAVLVPEITLHFWQWLSKYYLSYLGEVMNAGLPAAFKLSSESVFSLTKYYEEDKTELSNDAFIICELLQEKKVLNLQEIAQKSGIKNAWKVIQDLLKRGIVTSGESLKKKYSEKTEKHTRLSDLYDEEALSELLDHLEKKAPKQAELLSFLIECRDELNEIAQKELLKKANASATSLKGLEEKGIVEIYDKKIDRLALFEGSPIETNTSEFSIHQKEALQKIKQQWEKKEVALLHGITGSGKTHIYIQLLKETIDSGKQALYLLPEIALTTQIIKKLQSVFGKKVGVYHSGFSDAERVEIWTKVMDGEYNLILAARSGVFLPFTRLGMIVIDEEHDHSYKQFDPAPRYQGRDAAIYLAGLHKAKVLLGTATPSLESYENALTGKYAYVPLTKRFGDAGLPGIEILDLQKLKKQNRMNGHFSALLLEEIEHVLSRKEQVILFQNRRGFAPYVRFESLNEIPMCPNCDVSLTYHQINATLRCHYCGFKSSVEQVCKRYGANDMQVVSFGTEQIETEMHRLFPEARIDRLDLDNTRKKHAHAKIIESFEKGETDILVGTQMVTKGLDFDAVSLVAILQADHLLKFPDFRASERAYQIMEQVSGRAGRKAKTGKVMIQTTLPEHFVIQTLLNPDKTGFYKDELQQRKDFHYPPYYRLIKLEFKHKDYNVLWKAALAFSHLIKNRVKGDLLGPAPPIIGKIKNKFLIDFLIKMPKVPRVIAANKKVLRAATAHLLQQRNFTTIQVSFDVDP